MARKKRKKNKKSPTAKQEETKETEGEREPSSSSSPPPPAHREHAKQQRKSSLADVVSSSSLVETVDGNAIPFDHDNFNAQREADNKSNSSSSSNHHQFSDSSSSTATVAQLPQRTRIQHTIHVAENTHRGKEERHAGIDTDDDDDDDDDDDVVFATEARSLAGRMGTWLGARGSGNAPSNQNQNNNNVNQNHTTSTRNHQIRAREKTDLDRGVRRDGATFANDVYKTHGSSARQEGDGGGRDVDRVDEEDDDDDEVVFTAMRRATIGEMMGRCCALTDSRTHSNDTASSSDGAVGGTDMNDMSPLLDEEEGDEEEEDEDVYFRSFQTRARKKLANDNNAEGRSVVPPPRYARPVHYQQDLQDLSMSVCLRESIIGRLYREGTPLSISMSMVLSILPLVAVLTGMWMVGYGLHHMHEDCDYPLALLFYLEGIVYTCGGVLLMCYCYLYNPYCLERVIRLCLLAMFMVELAVLAVGTLWVMDNDIECVDTIIDNSRDCVLMLWTMVIIRLLGSLRVKEWMSAHTTIDGYANPHAQEYEYQHDHSKQKENDHQLRSGDMDVNIDVNEAKGR